jgi:hypothetical protein
VDDLDRRRQIHRIAIAARGLVCAEHEDAAHALPLTEQAVPDRLADGTLNGREMPVGEP